MRSVTGKNIKKDLPRTINHKSKTAETDESKAELFAEIFDEKVTNILNDLKQEKLLMATKCCSQQKRKIFSPNKDWKK